MPLTSTPSQYATSDQIQTLGITPADYARFEELAPGSVLAALQASSSEADSYLSGQFVTPIQTWDMALVRAVCWMAAKYLFDQLGYNPGAPADESIEKRYEQAIAWLSKIADKKISPSYVDSSGTTEPAGVYVVSDCPVGFTRTCDDAWEVW